MAIVCFLGAGAIYFGIGTKMDAPQWLRARLEARIAQDLNGLQLEFGDLNMVVSRGWRPRVGMQDVVLRAADGSVIVQLADAEISMAMRPLLRGKIQPKRISLSGLYANLRRETGGIALSFTESGSPLRQAANLPQLIEQFDSQFELPALAALTEVSTDGVTLRYEDARIGRVWTLDGGHIQFDRRDQSLTVSAGFSVLSGRQDVGAVEASYTSDIGDAAAKFGILVSDIASEDIAVQTPVLGWLEVLRAPISGSLRGGIASDGSLLPLSSGLQIGQGVIQPSPETLPIPIHSAHSYTTYYPGEQRLQFDELRLSSGWGSGTIVGNAELAGISDGRLTDLVGQLEFTDLTLNPRGLYAEPQVFAGVNVDFRLQPQPFRFQLGEMLIEHDDRQIRLNGEIQAGAEGWEYALDAQSDQLELAQIKALWPAGAAEKPRRWVLENIYQARAHEVNFALRGKGREKPFYALDANFSGAEVKFQKHLPRVKDGAGHFSLYNTRMVIVATSGTVTADEGGLVQVAGTSFIIPDTSVKDGTPGIARVMAQGPVTAGLSLLNRPPLLIMDKANLPVDLAAGAVSIIGTLALPLKPKVAPEEITYHYEGEVTAVRSSVLVPGHEVAAPRLHLQGNQSQVSLSGAGTLSDIPLTATWRQAVGAEASKSSQVIGEIDISQRALDVLNIGLPKGTLAGAGQGSYQLDLVPDRPPALRFSSDLTGLDLRIPAISWRKPPASKGELDLEVTLSTPVKIDSLQLRAPGLQAEGSVTTKASGGLNLADLTAVQVGNWMTGTVQFKGLSNGLSEMRVTSGTLDLQRAPFSSSSGGSSGSSEATGPISMRLARLQVTESIALTGFEGTFSTRGGFNGEFTGNLNGATAVSGLVVPQASGIAMRIRSEDAGGVFQAAGVLRHGRGGSFDMTLVPADVAGEYDGEIQIKNTRIKNAPSMAALLNAISVIGLLDELSGGGILFTGVEAKFRLGSTHLVLHESSAVGPSMGISMDGVYDLNAGVLDMRGVISPIYLINAIGRVVARKGEGLFGFAFRLQGTADDPKVSVNPLSALAPGMFREMFRGRQPVVPGAPAEEKPADPAHQPQNDGGYR
ncbi:AsmA-like C-terminal region-containing protein [Pseudophaeobacter sp.]|uniref:YhdP family protein n=1 Tax=Pseudophaeobacter sp. TaxID=1971739 RepID=UPI003299D767